MGIRAKYRRRHEKKRAGWAVDALSTSPQHDGEDRSADLCQSTSVHGLGTGSWGAFPHQRSIVRSLVHNPQRLSPVEGELSTAIVAGVTAWHTSAVLAITIDARSVARSASYVAGAIRYVNMVASGKSWVPPDAA